MMVSTEATCLDSLLVCPATKERLSFDWATGVVRVEETTRSYPIVDGIVDFVPGVADKISESYDAVVPLYDDYITSSSPLMRLVNRIAWGFRADEEYARDVLSFVPERFDGVLLDVPVGTGILTHKKYRRLESARIIALDYSLGMLQKAKRLYESCGIKNVVYVRADVGNLPVNDAQVDTCLSMNGFHAFPEKERALEEIRRVLRPRGRLAGCFYVRGKRGLTDLLIRHVASRQGTFTPPFWDEAEALSRFKARFRVDTRANLESILYFEMEAR
jgi:ubiquinone/menaquinone biosynthesis C-methylase UbiE